MAMSDSGSVRLVVADAEPVFRYGLRRLVEATRHIRVVAEASDMSEAIDAVRDCRPDLLMITLDIRGGGAAGLAALAALNQNVRCIVLTKSDLPESRPAPLTPGVFSILPKQAPSAAFIQCIQAARADRQWAGTGAVAVDDDRTRDEESGPAAAAARYHLTQRESQVVAAVVNGASNKDIAAQLSISLDTVKHHLANVFDKTGVGSRLELALFAIYHGLAVID
jgi:two-component system, NarL family, nitrate/nitrite response regulator NarL